MAGLTSKYDFDRIPPTMEPDTEPPEEILRRIFMLALETEQVKRHKQEAALVASKEASTAEAEAAEAWQRFEAELATYLGKNIPKPYN